MKRKYLVLGLLLLLVLLGCPMTPPTGTNPVEAGGGGARGTVTLSVPAISAYLAKALGVAQPGAAGKAVLIINRVDLELWLGGDEPVLTHAPLYPNSGPNMDQPIEWTVPAATGYTIVAKIYNTAVDAASPILMGESDPFDVTPGGTTDVTVRPIPLDPITVPFGTPVTETLASCFDTGETEPVAVDPGPDGDWGTADDIFVEQPVYGWAEERWFSFDTSPPVSAIRVNADADPDSGIYMVFADGTGRVRAQALSGAMGNMGPAYWTWGGVASLGALTQGSSECYLGLVTISDTVNVPVTSTVQVSFTPITDDVYEENDSIGAAKVLPQGDVIDGIDLDPTDWYTYPSSGGDWYSITQTEANADDVTIVLEFDMDQGDLRLELFGWNGSNYYEIDTSDDSVLSGPSDPAAKEEEQIYIPVLDPGVYYIFVRSGGPGPCGVPYKLQWVAGYGGIIIGIE